MKRNLTVTIALLGALATPFAAFAADTGAATHQTKADRAAANQWANTPEGVDQRLLNESNEPGGNK